MSTKDKEMRTITQVLLQNDEDEYEESELEEEDEELKFCGVCGDQAKGYHFNALTCEGCKGFFRRAINRSSQLQCPFLNKCMITKNNRRACQACRFRKCQAIGMRKEMVMSEKEVVERRIKIKKRKMRATLLQLSSQQEEMIGELLRAHRNTFDPAFSHFRGFRPMDRTIVSTNEFNPSMREPCDPLQSHPEETNAAAAGKPSNDLKASSCDYSSSSSSPSTSSSSSSSPGLCLYPDQRRNNVPERKITAFTALPHITDLTTYMIHNIIRFSKSLRVFRSLTIEDQITLLKGATFEIMQLRFNMVFNVKRSIWECGPISYYKDDAVRAGFQSVLIEPLFKFHHTLRKLGLQEEEYVLVEAISLFSPDRPGVQQHDFIDEQHENLALMLKTWIDSKRTGSEKLLLYPKVMACLTELRTMTEEYSKQVLQIQDIQPEDISPLIMEVFSKDT